MIDIDLINSADGGTMNKTLGKARLRLAVTLTATLMLGLSGCAATQVQEPDWTEVARSAWWDAARECLPEAAPGSLLLWISRGGDPALEQDKLISELTAPDATARFVRACAADGAAPQMCTRALVEHKLERFRLQRCADTRSRASVAEARQSHAAAQYADEERSMRGAYSGAFMLNHALRGQQEPQAPFRMDCDEGLFGYSCQSY